MTTSVLKMQRELVAVTEERDRLAAELQKLREQKPVVQYMARRLTPEATTEMWGYVLVEGLQPGAMLYAAPVAAPSVPEEWREVMAELAADLQAACDAKHPHREQYQSVMRKYQNDMRIVERARALLQSAEVRHDNAAADRLLEGGE